MATPITSTTFNLPRLDRLLQRLASDQVGKSFAQLIKQLLVPIVALMVFLGLWSVGAKSVETSLGVLPGPAKVWEQSKALYTEHNAERVKAAAFYERMEKRVDQAIADGQPAERIEKMRSRKYTGKETFIDQIFTSLMTVMAGFLVASLIAIPIGIVCGMSNTLYTAINPLIQIFKPVSPLAWLPLVTMVVSALYVTNDPMFSKSFLNSAITVTLCCLWPTIINTTVGVSGVDRDLINVSRVLRLSAFTKTVKIVLPSAIPMIFTGLRLSLGIGWMVLIAAEMLAQNPGLGKFVWDEFQNGSSNSLARIMVAVLVIGFIGFLLDRGMLMLQRMFSWDKNAILR
ncbi:MAG: ABC transporter permease [Candidatus Thiodiazotropha sp. (ex Ctena orbiculata)]|uniref:ABC transporter permease n=1 Tax=Candidatus Thiodiazotropha taylori TaxID=2792791 RepID=A0A944QUN2_9GAMM|nr:ABC transporter permease [Candidatus Thiodiazotropha taylori]PUB90183.1 MAG: nitrate ABC transporter permease [gamma proteobacterium symbiont of Ctena orbiculata]MBT2990302.1 ABC transporter permease [Candidatus Thiodiazotropha taylori]MBT2998230.1 ABC transporter permease [Candidatus Thiodiazotropha taylori]MBT3002528.1 ABC transporter permease [Candidatus Thiodiazotropha taylori]